MHLYSAYGLSVRSSLLLPELTSPAGAIRPVDVTIRLGRVRRRPPQLDPAGFGFWSTGDEACHVLEKVGAFLVRAGREIVIDPAPGVEDRLIRLSLLGPALGLLLHQRGLLVLHASVVARGDTAIAILGSSGWGKSTIAAALYAKGYDLVTDDVTAVRFDDDGPYVLPGFPQVKLWPEAATLLGETPEDLPLLHPAFDKRAWRVARGFSGQARRLRHTFVLAAGPAPRFEPLQPREACLELLAHWYGHRFGSGLLPQRAAAVHLRQCGELAGWVSMRRAYRSGGPATLLHLADLIDQDTRDDAGTLRSAATATRRPTAESRAR